MPPFVFLFSSLVVLVLSMSAHGRLKAYASEEEDDLSEAKWITELAQKINQDESLSWSVDESLGGPVHPLKKKRVKRQDPAPTVDWRTKAPRPLRPVQKQGACGSCWAFSATHTADDNYNIKMNKPGTTTPHLSVLQLVTCLCSWSALGRGQWWGKTCGRVGGCSGYYTQVALDYISKEGSVLETCKPYPNYALKTIASRCTMTCTNRWVSPSKSYPLAQGGWTYITGGAAAIRRAVDKGPVSAAFAVYDDFEVFGMSGEDGKIYIRSRHSKPNIDTYHAVEIVGYGTNAQGLDYWIVKNSWGTGWPRKARGINKGFFRIRRGTNEVGIESRCIAVEASIPSSQQTSGTSRSVQSIPTMKTCAPLPFHRSRINTDPAARSALNFMNARGMSKFFGSCAYNFDLVKGSVRELDGEGLKFTFQVN